MNLWQLFQTARERLHERKTYNSEFVTPAKAIVANATGKLEKVEARLAEAERLVGLFRRNYKDELKALYAQKNECYERLGVLKDEKSDFISEIQSVRADLRRWHDRADSWLPVYGKRGKEIPKHSFFSMSHGDREYLEDQRDSLSNDIDHVSSQISAIYDDEIGGLKVEIESVKADRTEWYSVKEAGLTYKAARAKHDVVHKESQIARGYLSAAQAALKMAKKGRPRLFR